MLHTFVVHVEDKPGVLNRVVSLFRRRAFNIESLSVGPTHKSGVSRMTLVVEADNDEVKIFEAHLHKLVNVLQVENLTFISSVDRKLALIKVSSTTNRANILQTCEIFRARVVDVAYASMIIEITGTPDKIEGFVEILKPFGILEMIQTGLVAMSRGIYSKVDA